VHLAALPELEGKLMPEYKIMGYDVYGNPVVETIQVVIEPGWKRILRRVAYWFGYGRFKRISGFIVSRHVEPR
jgi:hypothetical protein